MAVPERQFAKQNFQIVYSIESGELGKILLASTAQKICAIMLGDSETELFASLSKDFAHASISQVSIYKEQVSHDLWFEQIHRLTLGQEISVQLPLIDRGTKFQQQVWSYLRQIPYGTTCTYGAIAHSLGKSRAMRAVGSACGANPWALVVPCHRVIRCDGGLGGYRWGEKRKQKLLELEAIRTVSLPLTIE